MFLEPWRINRYAGDIPIIKSVIQWYAHMSLFVMNKFELLGELLNSSSVATPTNYTLSISEDCCINTIIGFGVRVIKSSPSIATGGLSPLEAVTYWPPLCCRRGICHISTICNSILQYVKKKKKQVQGYHRQPQGCGSWKNKVFG